MIDLLIAGGGPVGLGTAILAARAGLEVVVAEPHAGPIDKACGEGLMPTGVAALARLGVSPAGQRFAGIRYVGAGRSVDADFRGGHGLGVRRTALHSALSAAAADAGVRTIAEAVGEVRQTSDHVEAAGVRARYLAAADGLHSPIRRRLGVDRPSSGARRFGLRRHFAVAPWSDYVEVHWADGAEAYVTPVGPDLVGVAVLFTGRGDYDHWLSRFPAIRSNVDGAAYASDVRGAGPLRQRAATPVAGRVLFVGDAAGYVDALTGEGISVGLRSAAALVDCVRTDRPADYARAWRRATRRYRLFTEPLVRAAAVPALHRAVVPAAALMPAVFRTAVNIVSR